MNPPIDRSAAEIARDVNAGSASAAEIAEATLAHVAAVDGEVGSYLTVLHDLARAACARVDERVRAGERLPLAGVPMAVKDNMCLDGTRTTCGSKILEHWVAPYTATAVARLLEAGALPDRQDELRRVRDGQFVRELGARRHAQSVRSPVACPAARAADRRLPSPPTKRRSAWAATPAARFASPARSATSSASSRRTGASRATG